MKRRVTIAAVLLVVAAGWVVGLGCYPFLTCSPLNCRHEEIDINTGRIRSRRFLAGICVSERITDSPISRELRITGVSAVWRRAVTVSQFVGHSPHYVFHSSINQTRELELLWCVVPFSAEARRTTSQVVLRRWQTGQCDDAANAYLEDLATLAMNRESDAPPISVAELPGL